MVVFHADFLNACAIYLAVVWLRRNKQQHIVHVGLVAGATPGACKQFVQSQ